MGYNLTQSQVSSDSHDGWQQQKYVRFLLNLVEMVPIIIKEARVILCN